MGVAALLPEGESVYVLGVRVDAVSVERLLAIIAQVVNEHGRAIVAHVNINALNLSCELPWFRAFLNESDIVFCDGFGVKWGARLLGYHLPERITYADWMWKLAEFAEAHGFTFFLLGARPGVAERAAQRLQGRYRALRIVGAQHGYFDKRPGSPENEAVLRSIQATKPNLLVLGFGMPSQERWLVDNWLRVEANVALPGGAVFDYISGDLPRGPRWMTDHGLEWLSRLAIEPGRLWRRYVVGNPLFLARILRQRLAMLAPRLRYRG